MDFTEECALNISQEGGGRAGGRVGWAQIRIFPRGSFGLCLTAVPAFNYFAFELSERDPSVLKSALSDEGSLEVGWVGWGWDGRFRNEYVRGD